MGVWSLFGEIISRGGPVGAALVLAYMYIRSQDKAMREISAARVADAQAMVEKLLALNNKWNEALSAQTETAEAHKQLLADIKQQLFIQERYQRK